MPTTASSSAKRRRVATPPEETSLVRITPSTEISLVQESTAAKVRAAARSLKRAMPPVAKPGQKSAVALREEMWT